jgi:hypothetical protein
MFNYPEFAKYKWVPNTPLVHTSFLSQIQYTNAFNLSSTTGTLTNFAQTVESKSFSGFGYLSISIE